MKTALSIAFIIFMAWGWATNLIDLVHTDSINGLTIARAIGIFIPPLGTLLGYLF